MLTDLARDVSGSPASIGDSSCPLCFSPQLTVLMKGEARMLKSCLRCGVRYLYPLRSHEQISQHFSNAFVATHDEIEKGFEKNRANVLSSVAQYIQSMRSGGRILDVGCAGGYFLHRFFRKPGWETCGVELSPHAARQSSEKGINTQVGDLRSAGYAPNLFDVITVLDSFYYILEPRRELEEIRRVLKPDGLLVLELPLAGSRIWRTTTRLGKLVSRTAEPLLENYHNFFYNPKSISCLLRDRGFEIARLAPLAANRREQALQNVVWKAYYLTSFLVWHLSISQLMMGPRFLVAALKQ